MDPILTHFKQMTWRYAPQDPAAREVLSHRIAEAGRKGGTISYSSLVLSVTFHLPSLAEPDHLVDTTDWQDLDRAIVGDFLGYLSMESYERAGFLCSALVVSKSDGTPGEGFYTLLKDLGLIVNSKTDKAMYLWSDHVAKAHEYYARRQDASR